MNKEEIIDLSYPIDTDMLVGAGLERPVYEWLRRLNSEGLNLTRMSIVLHTGTHVDAPSHMIDRGESIDEIPLDRFFGTARLFRHQSENGREVSLSEVMESGFNLKENTIFVLETGIEQFAETAKYNQQYSVPSIELIKWLIERKVAAFMTDVTNIDPPGDEDFPRHKLMLGAGIPIVENLKNLRLLPSNTDFIICALPLKLKGREAAPCRAIAILKTYHPDKQQ